MAVKDTIAASAVALIVVMTGILYYHYYYFYHVRSSVFKTVRTSLDTLWKDRLFAANEDLFTTKLADTIQVLDSFENTVDPVIKNSIDLVSTDERACGRTNTVLSVGAEVLMVMSLIGGLWLSVRAASFIPNI